MKTLLLSIAAAILTLGCLEVALRACGYDAFTSWRNGRDLILRPSADPDLGYELTPGAAGFAWGADIRVNAHGFRGPEPRRLVEPGGRIVVLGDSITFGHQLREGATFPRLLETGLRKAGTRVEVLNFGVGGYDVLQEVSLLASRPAYHPTLVVVAYCLNDAGIASASREYIVRLQSFRDRLLYRSVLAQFVYARIETVRSRDSARYANQPEVFRRVYAGRIDPIGDGETELLDLMSAAPSGEPFEWYRSRDRVGRVRFAFRRLAALARQSQFPVVVMIVPWLRDDERGAAAQVVHRIVRLEARRAGFDTIDLTDDFARSGWERLRMTPGDPIHPNEAGHALMAEALGRYVREHGPAGSPPLPQ